VNAVADSGYRYHDICKLDGTRVPLGLFASLIATRLGRNVIDRTSLAGQHDFLLKWTLAARQPSLPFLRSPLFTAIQKQLSLRIGTLLCKCKSVQGVAGADQNILVAIQFPCRRGNTRGSL
jgi:uncharacterized protein (TIGR03435 family)